MLSVFLALSFFAFSVVISLTVFEQRDAVGVVIMMTLIGVSFGLGGAEIHKSFLQTEFCKTFAPPNGTPDSVNKDGCLIDGGFVPFPDYLK